MTTLFPQPCAEWAEVLTVTNPDDLAPSTFAALEAHLATCPACAAVRADYERFDRYIQRLPTSRPLPAFPPQLLAAEARQRAGRPAAPRLKESDGERPGSPRLVPQRSGHGPLSSGRLKSAATVAILLAIVALFAVLLRGFAAGRTQTGTHSQVPSIGVGQWTAIPGLTNQSGLPVIAPSDPNVIYEDLAPPNTPTRVTLRRSNDGGATWHTLPLPIQVPPAVDDSSLAVSPLDASTVFLTLSLPSVGNAQQCQAGQALNSGGNPLASFSGSRHCSIQFISTNGGQQWSLVHLPLPGAIGAPTFPEFFYTSSLGIFRAQGQRLYTALAAGGANIRGVAIDVESVRIVSSTDGGKSWQLVDAQLAASGENICGFAPVSSGTTLFAITQVDQYCYYDSTSPDYLWRSDDAGATWTQVSKLPALASNLTVVSQGGAAQPVLYAHMPVSAQVETIQPATTPTAFEVSTDGGQTWHQAPTSGLPQGTLKNYGPLAVLSDGSILKAFQVSDATLTLAAWKAGTAAWQQIVQHVDANLAYLLVTSHAGKNTIWTVSESRDGSYSVLRYKQ